VEIVFDGLRMGSFDGGLAYTFYPGIRLIQQEAVLTTYDAEWRTTTDAGLDMAAPSDRQPGNNMRTEASSTTRRRAAATTLNGLEAERVPVHARYRTLALKTAGGKRAVFPRAARVLFPRDFTSNLGFVWHRAWRGRGVAGHQATPRRELAVLPLGERAARTAAAHERVLSAFSCAPDAALAHVLRYTNGDRFRPLEGYKTLATHCIWLTRFRPSPTGSTGRRRSNRVLKAMGVDASMIMDFHGDGHPNDSLNSTRALELRAPSAARCTVGFLGRISRKPTTAAQRAEVRVELVRDADREIVRVSVAVKS